LSVCLFVCLSVCLFVCLSVCLFVCLSVCLLCLLCRRNVSIAVKMSAKEAAAIRASATAINDPTLLRTRCPSRLSGSFRNGRNLAI
jgi:hypothetical protein